MDETPLYQHHIYNPPHVFNHHGQSSDAGILGWILVWLVGTIGFYFLMELLADWARRRR